MMENTSHKKRERMRPMFIFTLEQEYIRVDGIEKFWVTDYPDPKVDTEFVVVATMKETAGDPSHDLFVSNDRDQCFKWLDCLVKSLNSVAE